MVFHVLNRRVSPMPIFDHEEDYAAFERVVTETLRVAPIRICAFCWMPNHWLCEASHKSCSATIRRSGH